MTFLTYMILSTIVTFCFTGLGVSLTCDDNRGMVIYFVSGVAALAMLLVVK